MLVCRFLILLVFAVANASAVARAQPIDEDGPTAKPTVEAALKELADRYGPAAVSLQAHLLAHAISAGSQLEATAAIDGIEARAGHDYLGYTLDTGIVYQATAVTRHEQLARIWIDVVDPCLRKAILAKLPGEGILLRIRSYRGLFDDRVAIVRERDAHRLESVATTFILPFDAIRALLEGSMVARDLGTRGLVELDGAIAELEIIPTPIPTPEPTAAANGD